MTQSPSSAGSAPSPAERRRTRVSVRVRRRRARQGSRWHTKWIRSRGRRLRTVVLSAGLLLVMGTGLYFGLSFLSSPPTNPRSVVGR